MHIGPAFLHGAQPINAPHRTQPAAPPQAARSNSEVDQLDISPQADFVSRARDVPEIRTERVAEIRAQIESGEYETEEKLNIAVERLFEEIGG